MSPAQNDVEQDDQPVSKWEQAAACLAIVACLAAAVML